MASIRKRPWLSPNGSQKTAWQVLYKDASGHRRAKQFDRKKEAEAWLVNASWEVKQGTHTPESKSISVTKAAANWLKRGERERLEQTTIDAYEQHVRLHIVPLLGAKRLNQLTKPMIEEFRDWLLDNGRSRAMAKRVLGSLSALIKEAERVGYVAQNVARGITVKRSGRERTKVVPPTKSQIRSLVAAAQNDKAQPDEFPILIILLFAGLRASELRGLAWSNVDLKAATITVTRRADRQNVIGPPKSVSGFRTIPVPALLVTELKKWKLRCPRSDLDLVFPSDKGTPMSWPSLGRRFTEPLQQRAGLTRPHILNGKPELDRDGNPVVEGLFGLHDLRHACASLWIEQRLQPKRVQTWMGHHSIQVTFDTYGHLFDALEDDTAITEAIEGEILGQEMGAA